MRERNSGRLQPTVCYKTRTFLNIDPVRYEAGSVVNGTIRFMRDRVTPGFRKISAKGGIVDSPMTSSTTHVIETPLSADTKQVLVDDKGEVTYYGHWVGMEASSRFFPTVSSIDTAELIGKASNQCLAAINPSLASLGVTYAERKKTAKSLRTIGRRIIKILKALRKKDKAYLAKVISKEELEKYYMEARYALRPLLIDAEGIFKSTQRQVVVGSTYRQTVRGRASGAAYGSGERTTPWRGALNASLSFTERAQTTKDVSVRAWATVEYSFDSILENELVHLGLSDWASTAWELVPFSFIVDWFFTTSDFVGTFNPTFGCKIISSGYTITTTSVTVQNCVSSDISDPPKGGKVWYNKYSGGSCTTTDVQKVRVITGLSRHWPNLDVRLDVFKLTDLAIIAKNLLPRRG